MRKKTEAAKTTRTRRGLVDRIQTFDLPKLTALKAQAEQTIRIIAAEGIRREQAHRVLQDMSILTQAATGQDTIVGEQGNLGEAATKSQPYAGNAQV